MPALATAVGFRVVASAALPSDRRNETGSAATKGSSAIPSRSCSDCDMPLAEAEGTDVLASARGTEARPEGRTGGSCSRTVERAAGLPPGLAADLAATGARPAGFAAARLRGATFGAAAFLDTVFVVATFLDMVFGVEDFFAMARPC